MSIIKSSDKNFWRRSINISLKNVKNTLGVIRIGVGLTIEKVVFQTRLDVIAAKEDIHRLIVKKNGLKIKNVYVISIKKRGITANAMLLTEDNTKRI
jgi:hypothetical protein